MTLRHIVVALVFGLALAAAPAQASNQPIVVSLSLELDRPASCAANDLFGLSFDMHSLTGTRIGAGQSCVQSIDEGCVPFVPFCRQTAKATFRLNFKRGSITAPMTLREVLPTDTTILQHGQGRIASGTGTFAGAQGSIDGGGAVTFTDSGPETALVYAIRLKGRG